MPGNKHNKTNTYDFVTPVKHKRRATSTIESPRTPANNDYESTPTPGAQPKYMKLEDESPRKKPKLTSNAPAIDGLYNHIVTLKIGPERSDFGVHDGLLRACSVVFKAVLDGENADFVTNDNVSGTLTLPEEDSATFTRVNRWLYSNELLVEGEQYPALTWTTLISIYLFAIKFKITRLQNKCIDAAILKHKMENKLPNAENIGRLWRPDPSAAPLRQLLLELFARRCDLKTAMAVSGRMNQDFLKGLVTELHQVIVEGTRDKKVHFLKRKREWYVHDASCPITLDDDT